MRKNEIKVKRTIEEIVKVEYIAEDGTVFYNKEECEIYEETVLFETIYKVKRLAKTCIFDLINDGSEDCDLEIFDVQTEEDLKNLKRCLYIRAINNGANEEHIKEAFTSIDDTRKDYVFDNVTIGHEVIIFWNYDKDWFWVYKDGSLDGYFKWLKEQYNKIISKEN